MSARARVAALAALIAAAAIAWLGTAGPRLHAPGGNTGGMASAPKTTPEPASLRQASGSASMPQGTSAASGPSALPEADEEALLARWRGSSLGGSEVDGVITLDAEGRPLPDAGLRRRFDYALALLGEFSLGEIRALVGHWARQAHGDAVAAEVLRLFDRYLALKQAESRIDPGLDPALRLERLARLRRDHFGAAAEAMFGEEEALARETLARLARGTGPDAAASERTGAEDTAPLALAEPPPRTLARTPALLAEHEAHAGRHGCGRGTASRRTQPASGARKRRSALPPSIRRRRTGRHACAASPRREPGCSPIRASPPTSATRNSSACSPRVSAKPSSAAYARCCGSGPFPEAAEAFAGRGSGEIGVQHHPVAGAAGGEVFQRRIDL
ncbi:MAG: hypothetical protein KatS3mg126_1494 [Lysobacteraceae bacterium]|nr:MAG: hypothetical protein KatS3mg126_1494 [Xanthomonadaceae bacterium]